MNAGTDAAPAVAPPVASPVTPSVTPSVSVPVATPPAQPIPASPTNASQANANANAFATSGGMAPVPAIQSVVLSQPVAAAPSPSPTQTPTPQPATPHSFQPQLQKQQTPHPSQALPPIPIQQTQGPQGLQGPHQLTHISKKPSGPTIVMPDYVPPKSVLTPKLPREIFRRVQYLPNAVFEQSIRDATHDHKVVILEVRIPREHLSASNKAIINRQLWGTDRYTEDSDLVCVAHHMGYIRVNIQPPAEGVYAELCMRVKLQVRNEGGDGKPPQAFMASQRFGLRSRQWCSRYDGLEMMVEECYAMTTKAATPDLLQFGSKLEVLSKCVGVRELGAVLGDVVLQSVSNPKFKPVHHPQQHHVHGSNNNSKYQKSNAGNGDDPKRDGKVSSQSQSLAWNHPDRKLLPRATLMFTLSNEPCLMYSLLAIDDRGNTVEHRLKTRLEYEVMILENMTERYELSLQDPSVASDDSSESEDKKKASQDSSPPVGDQDAKTSGTKYRLVQIEHPVRCSIYPEDSKLVEKCTNHDLEKPKPSFLSLQLKHAKQLPIKNRDDSVKFKVVAKSLDWCDIVWSDFGVRIRERSIEINKFAFVLKTGSGGAGSKA